MTGAMYAAIGGLKTHMTNLNVIGNNIANVNTTAYKAQRMIFEESIYTTMYAGSNGTTVLGGSTPSQVGYGAQVGSIDLNMSPGTFNPTGVGLDCMIDGDGFFMVGTKDLVFDDAEDYAKATLTRAGDLDVDPNGYITKGKDGYVVYGFAMVYNPNYVEGATEEQIRAAGDVNIQDKLILSTELVPLRIPLAAAEPTTENGGLDADGNGLWTTGEPVYSVLGSLNETTGTRLNVPLTDEMFYDEDGNFVFPDDSGVGTTDGTADGTRPQTVVPAPTTGIAKVTGLQINANGAIIGVADSGDTVVIGYVAIAQVDAPNGVTHVGGPYYKAEEGCGSVSVGIAGGIFDSGTYLNNAQVRTDDNGDTITPPIANLMNTMKSIQIQNGGLEASTADVATEFANMIVTQRGYQANTRIVTVTDSMLEELVNMKR